MPVWHRFDVPSGWATATDPNITIATRPGPGLGVGHLRIGDRAVLVAQVVAHRGHDDAVAQRHRADAAGRQEMRVRLGDEGLERLSGTTYDLPIPIK